MKQRYLPFVLCCITTWASSSTAETTAAAKKTRTSSTATPVTTPAAAKLPKTLQGVAPIDAARRLALAREIAGAIKLSAPAGLEQTVKLSARHPYEAGRADLSINCATTFDPVADVLVPQVYKYPKPGPSLNFGLPQIPKPLCETDRSQATRIRVLPSKAGQAVLFDITVENAPSALGIGQTSTLELVSSAAPGALQSWELGPGEAGHLTGIMMPPGLSWVTLELRLVQGDVKIRGVELTPLQ